MIYPQDGFRIFNVTYIDDRIISSVLNNRTTISLSLETPWENRKFDLIFLYTHEDLYYYSLIEKETGTYFITFPIKNNLFTMETIEKYFTTWDIPGIWRLEK